MGKLGDPNHLAAGASIEMVDSWNGVVHYTSKYITNLEEHTAILRDLPQAIKDKVGILR